MNITSRKFINKTHDKILSLKTFCFQTETIIKKILEIESALFKQLFSFIS